MLFSFRFVSDLNLFLSFCVCVFVAYHSGIIQSIMNRHVPSLAMIILVGE